MGRSSNLAMFLTVSLLIWQGNCHAQQVSEPSKAALRKRLLQPPTELEIRAVLDACRKADTKPQDVTNHGNFVLANKNRLSIVSHSVEGQTHFGAIVRPTNPKSRKLPVVIMACGGDGMSIDLDITKAFAHDAVQFPEYLGGGLDTQFVVVIPSFRGQKLIYQDREYQSAGNVGDAFDGATTDALSLLNVVLETVDIADEERVAICGGSRGGTVALLAAAREKKIRKAVVIAAPTDMHGLFLLYPEQFELLFFKDLFSGGILEEEARRRFIASSPNHFAIELPKVQIHHDKRDPFVPVDFAHRFVKEMKDKKRRVEAHYYEEEMHGFWKASEFWRSVQGFLSFD